MPGRESASHSSGDSAPGRWHLVAGYLPRGADPLEHALTEVAEETGLESTQVRLMAQGGALSIGESRNGPTPRSKKIPP